MQSRHCCLRKASPTDVDSQRVCCRKTADLFFLTNLLFLAVSSMMLFVKKDIHPKYYPEAKVSCSCGAVFAVGSTKPELRVERFKSKIAKAASLPRAVKKAAKKNKK